MIPTSFLGWRRLRQKRQHPLISDRFEDFCEYPETGMLPIGSFSRIEERVEYIFTRYPNLQKASAFLKDFDKSSVEKAPARYRLRFQTNAIHEPIFRNLVMPGQLDEDWFQQNDKFIQSLCFREKMALVAMTNKSQQHVQAWTMNKIITKEFMDRVRNWRNDVFGYLPIFFPLLDRFKDDSLSNRQNYRRIVKTICPTLTDDIITECVRDLSAEITAIFKHAPKTKRDMIVYRGLKHQPKTRWTRQGFAATTLNPFHALIYAEHCLQQIRVLPGTPFLFVGGLSSFRNDMECILPDTVHFYRTEQSYQTIPTSPVLKSVCPRNEYIRRMLIQKIMAII